MVRESSRKERAQRYRQEVEYLKKEAKAKEALNKVENEKDEKARVKRTKEINKETKEGIKAA